MAFGYNYGGYPGAGGYYAPPVPDQLAQLRQNQMQQSQMMQPMQGQMQPMQAQPMQSQTQQADNGGIIWVQGEAGAKAYLVAPGNTVQLWDSENQVIYLKSADMSGMPSMRVLDYTERTAPPRTAPVGPQAPQVQYVTLEEFNALADRLTALENKPCKCSEKKKVKEETEDA